MCISNVDCVGMTLDGPESAEELLKRSKKNQPVMLFVTVKGEPSKAFAEQVSTLTERRDVSVICK